MLAAFFQEVKGKIFTCQGFGSENVFLTPKEEQKCSTYKNKLLRTLEHKTKHWDSSKFIKQEGS